ncbi:hypothetical protein RCL1_001876 [Eukaryota sp. TZLM3-RCL]
MSTPITIRQSLDESHLKRRVASLESRNTHLEELVKQYESDIEKLTKSDSLRNSYLQKLLTDTQSKLDEEKQISSKLQSCLDSIQADHLAETSILTSQISAFKQQIEELNSELNSTGSKLHDSKTLISTLQDTIEVQKTEIKSLRERVNILTDQTLDLSAQAEKCSILMTNTFSRVGDDDNQKSNNYDSETDVLMSKLEKYVANERILRRELELQKTMATEFAEKSHLFSKSVEKLEDQLRVAHNQLESSVPRVAFEEALESAANLKEKNSIIESDLEVKTLQLNQFASELAELVKQKEVAESIASHFKEKHQGTAEFICTLLEECKEESLLFAKEGSKPSPKIVLENLLAKVSIVPGLGSPFSPESQLSTPSPFRKQERCLSLSPQQRNGKQIHKSVKSKLLR